MGWESCFSTEGGNTCGYSPAGGSAGAGQQSMERRKGKKQQLCFCKLPIWDHSQINGWKIRAHINQRRLLTEGSDLFDNKSHCFVSSWWLIPVTAGEMTHGGLP